MMAVLALAVLYECLSAYHRYLSLSNSKIRTPQATSKYKRFGCQKDTFLIGRLHDGVILLPRPDCFVKMLCYSYLSSLLGIKKQLEKLARH